MTNQAAQTMPELPKSDHWGLEEQSWLYTDDQMHQYASDYAAALSQPAGVPEGWMLVHRQTLEIVGEELANARDKVKPAERAWLADLNRVVRGMLAAAPAASGGEVWTREMVVDAHRRGEELYRRIRGANPPSGASLSSNPNPVTPGLSSEPGASVSERALEAVAWAAYGTSDELGPVMLPDYVGTMDVIRKRVMEDARREGFNGHFVERMANLGWWVEPLFHAPAIERALSSPRQEGEVQTEPMVCPSCFLVNPTQSEGSTAHR